MYLDPFQMNMMLSSLHYIPTNVTCCNTTRASDLAEDEQLRAFQRYLKKLCKHGAFSMVCLPVQCSCAGVFHFGRYRFRRQYVSVSSSDPVFVIAMLVWSPHFSCCLSVQLRASLGSLLTGTKIRHQTGMAMTRVEASGSG